jgi:hypothetical protein
MAELVPLLGAIAVLLTLIGSYRLFGYFFDNDPVFAGLFSVAVTVSFLVILDFLLLALGTAVLILPVVGAIQYTDSSFSLDAILSDTNTGSNSKGGSNSGSAAVKCSNCGEPNAATNRRCDNCGKLI